jgi:hypothetical protein
MKTFTLMMIFAAAAVSGAYAQASTMLRAEVPFPFSMNGTEFRPGAYQIRSTSMPEQLELYNVDDATMSKALYLPGQTPRERDGKSKLVFQCIDGACVLVDVWDSKSGVDFRLPVPKDKKGSHTWTVGATEKTVKLP